VFDVQSLWSACVEIDRRKKAGSVSYALTYEKGDAHIGELVRACFFQAQIYERVFSGQVIKVTEPLPEKPECLWSGCVEISKTGGTVGYAVTYQKGDGHTDELVRGWFSQIVGDLCGQ